MVQRFQENHRLRKVPSRTRRHRVTIEYRARLLPNGTVNIGTFCPVK